jgi:hypothetical protein
MFAWLTDRSIAPGVVNGLGRSAARVLIEKVKKDNVMSSLVFGCMS